MEEKNIKAWKDVEARDGGTDDHPAGEMKLPGRLATGRAAILAGYVAAVGMVINLPTIPSTSCITTLC
jgi:hypothetical protein